MSFGFTVQSCTYRGPSAQYVKEFSKTLPNEVDCLVKVTAFGPCSDFRYEADELDIDPANPLFDAGANNPTYAVREFIGNVRGIRQHQSSITGSREIMILDFNGIQINSNLNDLPKIPQNMQFFTANNLSPSFQRYTDSVPMIHQGLIMNLTIPNDSIDGVVRAALPNEVPNVLSDLVLDYHAQDIFLPIDVAPERHVEAPRPGRFDCVKAVAANLKSAAKTVCCWKCCCG